jgi:ubiquinone/menaquinone biosynthesis C-methylase UbiE
MSDQILDAVKTRYATAANTVLAGEAACCDSNCCSATAESDPITGNLYSADQSAVIPMDALAASLGCGNPTALAELHEGETVLDLGSGGGIDVLLSARRVGPTGHAYGVDMLDEMLELAERNKAQAGAENVTFLKGSIENVPLPDNSVDVIISNCVINLAVDKGPVLKEAYRVLKPGGRFAVSDVVTQGTLPEDLQKNMEAWIGCIAGALEENNFRALLAEAGFGDISFQETRVYDPRELFEAAKGGEQACCSPGSGSLPDALDSFDGSSWERFEASGGRMISAFVRATKPE